MTERQQINCVQRSKKKRDVKRKWTWTFDLCCARNAASRWAVNKPTNAWETNTPHYDHGLLLRFSSHFYPKQHYLCVVQQVNENANNVSAIVTRNRYKQSKLKWRQWEQHTKSKKIVVSTHWRQKMYETL